jgi:hypothetical protein
MAKKASVWQRTNQLSLIGRANTRKRGSTINKEGRQANHNTTACSGHTITKDKGQLHTARQSQGIKSATRSSAQTSTHKSDLATQKTGIKWTHFTRYLP